MFEGQFMTFSQKKFAVTEINRFRQDRTHNGRMIYSFECVYVGEMSVESCDKWQMIFTFLRCLFTCIFDCVK